jgi:hypothetical protein
MQVTRCLPLLYFYCLEYFSYNNWFLVVRTLQYYGVSCVHNDYASQMDLISNKDFQCIMHSKYELLRGVFTPVKLLGKVSVLLNYSKH